MSVNAALPIFIAEAEELLRDMETGLLECARGTPDSETINLIFRAAHTIKGSSGLFGLDSVVWFVHGVETALDRVRQGKLPMDSALVDLLLGCKDHIGTLVESVADADRAAAEALQTHSRELLGSLQAIAGDLSDRALEVAAPTLSASQPSPSTPSAAALPQWHICLRPRPDVFTLGLDPLSFIRYLGTFGEIVQVKVTDEQLPGAADFDPQRCYVAFEVDFRTAADQAKIEGAFEFLREDCELQVSKVHPAEQKLGAVPPAAPVPAERSVAKSARTVRVDADKLDFLIDRIGELITAAARSNLIARRSKVIELEESAAAVGDLIEEVREGALQLRMIKIGGTFARFERVVHDVSREIGKEISLVLEGEDTELDKTVVERITDPLTHLVRNAIDHGIEARDLRLTRGKPAEGTIRLTAFHESGHIVIQVSDDGGGLDKDRIVKKALERGLIEPGRTLSPGEAFALIFEPGFSTAEQITNLSGRGVGMDVVKRNITALRGTVSVASEPGKGTTVTVRLPLTLAIINGFQIAVGSTTFVLPLDAIDECLEFSEVPGHDFTDLRGDVLPFLRLRDVFGISAPVPRRQSIVVVRNGAQRAGLVVDALLGEFQTVIKPLGRMLGRNDCLSGSSILGTGDVALIVDIPALLRLAVQRAAA